MGASASRDFIQRTDGYPPVCRQAQATLNLCVQKPALAVSHRLCPRKLSRYRRADVRVLARFDQLPRKRECCFGEGNTLFVDGHGDSHSLGALLAHHNAEARFQQFPDSPDHFNG